jgi:hypothetical protein
MAQLLVVDKIANSLNLDKIIRKLEYKLLGFGIEYISDALIEYIESNKRISFDYLVLTITNN